MVTNTDPAGTDGGTEGTVAGLEPVDRGDLEGDSVNRDSGTGPDANAARLA